MLQNVDVVNVRTVTLHQCPASKGVVDYTIGVDMCTGLHKTREFRSVGVPAVHDSFVLYDRMRDGVMQYLHLLH